MARVERDYRELLELFNKHQVKYCIVGAYAVGFYALPRYTKDLDILVEPSLENGQKITNALGEFGFSSLKLSPEDFSRPGRIVQLGYEPVRIDLITSLKGYSFNQVWKNKKKGLYGREEVYFIGRNELIKNKRSSGRKQDLADLELLTQPRRGVKRS